MSDNTIRRCGLAAVALAWASLVLAPLNALARMRTESGRSDLEPGHVAWWAEPALRVLTPWLLDFADPDTVYLTYGKFYAVAVAGVVACMLAARSVRPGPMRSIEVWGWRTSLAGYGLLLLGHLGYYWLELGDVGYLSVLLGMLVGIPGALLLGAGLLRAGFRPRTAAWLVLLDLPLSLVLVAVSTQALGMWPMMLAWGLVGSSLRRGPTELSAPEWSPSAGRPVRHGPAPKSRMGRPAAGKQTS